MNDDQRALLNLIADFGRIAQEAIDDKSCTLMQQRTIDELKYEVEHLKSEKAELQRRLDRAIDLLRGLDIRYGLVSIAEKLRLSIDPQDIAWLIDQEAIRETLGGNVQDEEVVEQAGLGIFDGKE